MRRRRRKNFFCQTQHKINHEGVDGVWHRSSFFLCSFFLSLLEIIIIIIIVALIDNAGVG